MKSSYSKRGNKRILTVSLAVLVLFAALVTALELTHKINLVGGPTNGPSAAQKAEQAKSDADQKQSYLDSTYKDSVSNDSSNQSTSPSSHTPTPATISLTASQQGTDVVVTTKMQNVSSGNCSLTVSSGGQQIAKEAGVLYQPEFSSCAGFAIPTSTLGPGTWTLKLVVNNSVDLTKQTTLVVK